MRPISHRLLCAMAQAVFDPTLDDGEWAERVKQRLADQDFTNALPHELTAALRAVERTLARDGLSRLSRSRTVRPSQPAFVRPLSHDEAIAARQLVGQRFAVPPIRSMPRARVPTRREAEVRKAMKILQQGIAEQSKRCDDAERVVIEHQQEASDANDSHLVK